MKPGAVMIVGSATIDKIVQCGQTTSKIGGVVTYAGLTFREHGIQTTVRCNISKRDKKLFDLYRQHQIRLVNGPTSLTTRFVNNLEGDLRRQEAPGRAERIRIHPALPELRLSSHIHLGPLFPEDLHPDSLPLLAWKGRLVTLDVQGYIRQVRGKQVVPRVSKHLKQALEIAHVVKAGSQEMDMILDTYRLDVAALKSRFQLREILITSGERGGSLISENGERIEYEAAPVERIVDTTGAGDVLFAAYLAKRFYEGFSVNDAITHASQVAALQVSDQYIPGKSLRIH